MGPKTKQAIIDSGALAIHMVVSAIIFATELYPIAVLICVVAFWNFLKRAHNNLED